MRKKLTITVDEEVYAGLHRAIGPRKISRFIEDLVRPHVMKVKLESAYKRMAQDEARETQALELGRRSSVYTYLAPLNCENKPSDGGVLRFFSEELPIFPDGREPYRRMSKWGTLIKLYEYIATGYKTHILRKDGILSRIDLLLPDVALPIRLHGGGHYGPALNT